jgi:hypothetical protein
LVASVQGSLSTALPAESEEEGGEQGEDEEEIVSGDSKV